jgi:integrase
MAALFEAAKSYHFLMFLMLATNTLARPEAILELQPFQVDLEHRLINLNPAGRKQTKKRRPTVPITETLLPWVRDVKAPYLVSYGTKTPRRVRSIKKAFRLARAAAGLGPDVIPYTIRHTMATELRKRGVPAWEVAGMLGHRVERTTEIYAKFDPTYLSAAARAIDDYMRELQAVCKQRLILAAPGLTVIEGGK